MQCGNETSIEMPHLFDIHINVSNITCFPVRKLDKKRDRKSEEKIYNKQWLEAAYSAQNPNIETKLPEGIKCMSIKAVENKLIERFSQLGGELCWYMWQGLCSFPSADLEWGIRKVDSLTITQDKHTLP